MKLSKKFFRPQKKSYVHMEFQLSGKVVVLGLGVLGIASGLNYFLKFLVRKFAYKTVYGRLPEEENSKLSKEKKKPIGFACEPVRSEESD